MLLKPLFIFSYFEFNCWFSHKMLLKQVKYISKFSYSPMMFIATFEYMKLSNILCQNSKKVIHNAPRIIGDPAPCPAPSPLFNLPNFFHPFIYQLCPSIETYLTYWRHFLSPFLNKPHCNYALINRLMHQRILNRFP